MRTLQWNNVQQELTMVDQRVLPARFEWVTCRTAEEVATAIRDMTVRGAPAIGVSAAYGLALAGFRSRAASLKELKAELCDAGSVLNASRPTAVNLGWAVKRMLKIVDQANGSIDDLRLALINGAEAMADEDVEINLRIARHGAELIQDGDTIVHHCNTGALATVDWGTALGIIRMAHESGKHIHVLVDETRPRMQGARLTAWELQQYGVPFEIISDGASGYFLHSGQVQKVFFGGDRVAANGDVANKVGSYMLALAAHANDVPVYSVVPTSTVDLMLANGDLIPIEERPQSEVLDIQLAGQLAIPAGAKARNPAFDVTPHHLLTGIVTENGVVYPPFRENLPKFVHLTQGD